MSYMIKPLCQVLQFQKVSFSGFQCPIGTNHFYSSNGFQIKGFIHFKNILKKHQELKKITSKSTFGYQRVILGSFGYFCVFSCTFRVLLIILVPRVTAGYYRWLQVNKYKTSQLNRLVLVTTDLFLTTYQGWGDYLRSIPKSKLIQTNKETELNKYFNKMAKVHSMHTIL